MTGPPLYDSVRSLELDVDEFATERREARVSTDFTRVTTTVILSGRGAEGRGEDVTYQAELHDDFGELRERGKFTIESFSTALEPYGHDDYRRWAFESAALDLALRQRGVSLGDALGRESRPVRFVVSTRLEIGPYVELYPDLEFKVDPTSEWTDDRIREIAALDRVRIVDFKGQYHGTVVDQPADPRLYRSVVEAFDGAIVEDPALTDETREALRGSEDRWSWDAPIHSAADIAERAPRWCNIKPSRFGTVQRLFEAIDYCNANDIRMYGGGQFELGVGRGQIQALASLFYPDSPNDVAPGEYNLGGAQRGLPQSPLAARADAGF